MLDEGTSVGDSVLPVGLLDVIISRRTQLTCSLGEGIDISW